MQAEGVSNNRNRPPISTTVIIAKSCKEWRHKQGRSRLISDRTSWKCLTFVANAGKRLW